MNKPSKTSTILYGIHPCLAALRNPHRHIKRIITTEKVYQQTVLPCLKETGRKNIFPVLIEPKDFAKYCPTDAVHQQLVLEVEPLSPPTLEEICEQAAPNARIMILDQLNDPHNVGAILRTCAVFGVDALIVTEHASAAVTPTLAKSASGAMEFVPMITVTNLAQTMEYLKKNNFWFMGLDEDGTPLEKCSPKDFQGRLGIVMGAEHQGMRRLTREHCDFIVRIPTTNEFSTLNVSNAAAVILYECWRQKEKQGE